ncbi:type II secretion system F family protein [Candidatus Woesebacteria bacterium]|nr:type II secretion system F family protein [Candidatus Woesebacteria bacterium]
MPLYSYKVKNKKGKVIEDVAQSASRQETASMLKAEGYQVLTVKAVNSKVENLFEGKISVADKAAFCRFMATMLKAGLPLPEAIEIIQEETTNKKFKKILYDVSFNLKKGSSLHGILSKYESDFGTIFLTILKAGEESGSLEKSFGYLSQQLLQMHELSQKIKGSMMYPLVIVGAMIANGILMFTFVLPKLSQVFLQLNADLPRATEILLQVGTFLGGHVLLTIGTVLGLLLLILAIFMIKKTRDIVVSLFIRLPVVSKVVSQIDASRFARTLSTLLKSGVPITVALDVSSDVVMQSNVKKVTERFSKGVEKGESLSEILEEDKKSFPPVMIQTIKAGEKTGSLEVVLEEMAGFYESEVDYSLKRATSLLEPILLLIIGLAVGAMAVLMITPIYSVVGSMDGSF